MATTSAQRGCCFRPPPETAPRFERAILDYSLDPTYMAGAIEAFEVPGACVALPILPVLDLTPPSPSPFPVGTITMAQSEHRFSRACEVSPGGGPPSATSPIIGTTFFASDTNYSRDSRYSTGAMARGLPIIRFKRGTVVALTFDMDESMAEAWTNMHFHGLNTNTFTDGASTACEFGAMAPLGVRFTALMRLFNNACTCWYHSHNMLGSSPYVTGGMFGLLQITDDAAAAVDALFVHGANHLQLVLEDQQLDPGTGVQDTAPAAIYNTWRGPYVVCNGVACGYLPAATVPAPGPAIDLLTHVVPSGTPSTVKVSLLNGTTSWTRYYVGVCGKDGVPRTVWFVQTDQGYRDPVAMSLVAVSPGNRVSILFDLQDFADGAAYVFLMRFDLTAINGLVWYDGALYDTAAEAPFEPTHPTPYGVTPMPTADLRPMVVLKVVRGPGRHRGPVLRNALTAVQDVVFGQGRPRPARPQDYWRYLNPRYYYNLPSWAPEVPTRQFALFFGPNSSAQANGATEYVYGSRVMVDAWNDAEWAALEASGWNKRAHPPTLRFSVVHPTDAMQARFPDYYMCVLNYQLVVTVTGAAPVTVVFPPLRNVDVVAWAEAVAAAAAATPIVVPGHPAVATVADVFAYDWAPASYAIPYVSPDYRPDVHIRTVQTRVTSLLGPDTQVTLSGPWALLQYFGKPMTAMVGDAIGPNLQSLMVVFDNTATPSTDGRIDLPLSGAPYVGYVDGFMNDSLQNFSVRKDATERWVYNNLDNEDSHPFHFHMTSGYLQPTDPVNAWLLAPDAPYTVAHTYQYRMYA